MPERRVLTYTKIEGGLGEYVLGRFDTILHIKCPIDRTNLIQSQQQDSTDFCPNCGTRYDSLVPEEMLKTASARVSNLPRELQELREEEQKLVAIITAARERGI